MMKIWRERSAIKPLRNKSSDPSNRPCATRTRKMRTKKKMPVPLQLQQKTYPPVTKTMKVLRTTGKMMVSTNMKTPCSMIPKTTSKKLHWVTKANYRHQNCWRVQTRNMKRTTEQVPRTSTSTSTATAKGDKNTSIPTYVFSIYQLGLERKAPQVQWNHLIYYRNNYVYFTKVFNMIKILDV